MCKHLAVAAIFLGAVSSQPDDDPTIEEARPCGHVCAYVVARVTGADVTWDAVAMELGRSAEGAHSFAEMERSLRRLGMHPLLAHVSPRELRNFQPPAILHCTAPAANGADQHMVVALSWTTEGAVIFDFPYRARFVPWRHLDAFWTGNAILVPASSALENEWRGRLSARFAVLVALRVALAVLLVVGALFVTRTRFSASSYLRPLLARWLARLRTAAWTAGDRVRRRTQLAAFCVVLAVGLAALIWMAKPMLELPGEVVDLGELPSGIQTSELPVHNTGLRPLSIQSVQTSCSCAGVQWPPVVAGRSRGSIVLKLKVTPGPRSADITVRSSDTTRPRHVLLRWRGPAEPRFFPPRVRAVDVDPARPYVRVVRVAYAGGLGAGGAALATFECDTPGVTVTALGATAFGLRTDGGDRGPATTLGYLRLRLQVDPALAARSTNTECKVGVRSNGHDYKMVLPVSVSFDAPAKASPSGVFVCGASWHASTPVRRLVKIAGISSPVTVVDQPPWVTCAVDDRDDVGMCALNITPEAGFRRGVVLLRHDAIGELLRIPVTSYFGE